MNIWPWSRFDKLQRELAIKQGQLDACSGRFGFTDANMPSLVEVMGLIQTPTCGRRNRDWYIAQLEGALERARAGLPPRL
jgi:hypothetical protein